MMAVQEQKKEKKEPLFHIVRRTDISTKTKAVIYAIAILAGFLISSLICWAFGEDATPIDFFASMFTGAFGTKRLIWLLLQDMALLLGVSVALVPAFKMKFWNLGGNGQVLMGCLASIFCMFYFGDLNNVILIPLMLVASLAAGVLWAAIPGIFKAYFDTNESLFTLMLNYIAQGLVAMFITIWVKSGSGVLSPLSAGNLPEIGGNRYILIIVVLFLLAGLMYCYLRYTKHGYELTVVGESPNTAKYIGINVKAVIIRTLILSGAIAGLVGFFLAAGINHTVSTASANNMGFTAIMTSWLAGFNPLLMFASCFFITFVNRGMQEVRMNFSFENDSISNIVVGIIYFCVIAVSFFITYQVVFRKNETKTKAKEEN
ncbi:MAG: ABC transporter permease [Clostridia bacterium]|nr:ABC transporter permease [Clostridia bacterium]